MKRSFHHPLLFFASALVDEPPDSVASSSLLIEATDEYISLTDLLRVSTNDDAVIIEIAAGGKMADWIAIILASVFDMKPRFTLREPN
ncbi:unnamed protein product [Orchesella dallaii]|uniref:Uncharacterized protein n=1 Tax=Orchesella dallaii TaxID=48710 RepID=A0ABP1R427_9HEXA